MLHRALHACPTCWAGYRGLTGQRSAALDPLVGEWFGMGRGLVDTKNTASRLARYAVQLFCYQLMPNHWHLLLRPAQDAELSRFLC